MEGMIGEIRMFAGTFAPKSWALCAGQIVNISSNTALFSILGTTYGGNGTTTFGLPDLRGRMVIGAGQGPGLTPMSLGATGGNQTATLTTASMPIHTHPASGTFAGSWAQQTSEEASTGNPSGSIQATSTNQMFGSGSELSMGSFPVTGVAGAAATLGQTGAGMPFSIMSAYLITNYVICQYGMFPARN